MSKRIEEWRGIIAECKSSGSSQKDFCKEKDLSFSTFQYWRTRINKLDSSMSGTNGYFDGFIRHALPHVGGGTTYILEWPDGMRLRIPLHASVEEISTLTERLRKALG
jgi:hypothetical protein